MRIIVTLLFLLVLFCLDSNYALAAVKCWVGPDGGNWSTATNWQTSLGVTSALTSGDVATFDPGRTVCAGATTDTNSTIDTSAAGTVYGIDIKSAYTQTITQTAGITVTIDLSGFSQAGGTYTATTGTFDNNGSFTLSGGTFTPGTTANTHASNFTISGTGNYNIGSTATTTFDRTGGTITVPGALAGISVVSKTISGTTIIASTTILNLGNSPSTPTTALGCCAVMGLTNNGTLIINSGMWTINGYFSTFTNNGTITHNGNGWDINRTNFINNGTITYAGTTITADANFTQNGTFNMSGKAITFDGVDNIIITANGALGGTVVITKPSGGNVTVASGTSINLGDSPTSVLGTSAMSTLTNNGTTTINSGTWTLVGSLSNGGAIVHNGNGWIMANSGSQGATCNFTNNASGTIAYAGTTLSISGDFTKNGTFDLTGKTVTFIYGPVSTVTTAGALGGTVVITKGGNCLLYTSPSPRD